MKKVVGMVLALSLIVSPTLASAAASFDGDFLVAKKGGNGGGSSGGSSGGNSSKASSSSNSSSPTSTINGNNKADAGKSSQVDIEKQSNTNTSKSDNSTKVDVKQEKTRILNEANSNKAELKTQALEFRKQFEATVESGAEKAELLETTAELLDEAGELDEAIATQEEAVQEDLTNVDRYKKLAKLMEKNGNKEIKAFVNGEHPVFDVPPVIKSGRTLVPIRAISQSLGAEVNWNQEEQTAIIVKDGVEIKLVLNEVKAYVNGEEIELDVPSTSINSRIVVPLRFISEAFDAAVQWEDETDSIIIVDDENAADETNGETGTEETSGENTTEETNETGTTDNAATEDATTEDATTDLTTEASTTEGTNNETVTGETTTNETGTPEAATETTN